MSEAATAISQFALGAEYGAIVAALEHRMASFACMTGDLEFEHVINSENLLVVEAYCEAEGLQIESSPSGFDGKTYIRVFIPRADGARIVDGAVAVDKSQPMSDNPAPIRPSLRIIDGGKP